MNTSATPEQIELLYFIGILPQIYTINAAPTWVGLQVVCTTNTLVNRDLDLFVPSLLERKWAEYNCTLKAVRITPTGRKVLADALRPPGAP